WLQPEVHPRGQPHPPKLAHGVRDVATAEQSREGGGVDDMSSDALVDQDRQKSPHAVDHAHQVYAKDPVPVVQGAPPARRRLAGDAGVVADDVDSAEVTQRLVGTRLDLLSLRHTP